MIKWPERAKAAIRKLFEPLQDIDVYVEDTNDEAFYRCLLEQATQGKVQIARVFSLGGRPAVVEAAKNHDQKSRRALFIIDGDLPWVGGTPPPNIVGLHQHDAYCVENLLLCEKAITTLLSQETGKTELAAKEELSFQQWLGAIRAPLSELFAAFATLHEFDPQIKTVSQGVGVMCIKRRANKVTELDAQKVKSAQDNAIRSAKAASSPAKASQKYDSILLRIRALPESLLAVSGKDFLLPLLDFHLQSFGCRIKRRSLRMRLASAGDPTRFARLAAALEATAKRY